MLDKNTDGMQIDTTPHSYRLISPKALAKLSPPRNLINVLGDL